MSSLPRAVILGTCVAVLLLVSACASGRVRGAQATEMKQAEEYQPKKNVEPPEGNISRETDTYTILEVDIERRRPPPGPALEPEPEPQPPAQTANEPE